MDLETMVKRFSMSLPTELTTVEENGRKIMKAVVSAEIVDSDGDAILVDGIDYTTRYGKNPAFLYDHKLDNPLGHGESMKRFDGFLHGSFCFMDRPESHPKEVEWEPDTRYAQVKDGTLNAVSIGFDPSTVEARKPTVKDIERFGPKCRRVISKLELAEVSLTTVPANMLTLVTEVKRMKGLGVKAAEIPPSVPDPAVADDALAKLTAELETARKRIEELEFKLTAPAIEPVVVATKSLQEQVTAAVDEQLAGSAMSRAVAAEVERQAALRRGVFFLRN